MDFCIKEKTDPLQTTSAQVLAFFTELFETVGYSALNTARASLSPLVSLTDGYNLGNHPLIIRFFKGAFNIKPPKPRYHITWDVKIVLDYLRKLSPAKKLGLKELSMKTCMLLSLVSAQRQQTLHMLNVVDMDISVNSIIFFIHGLLKHSRPGNTGLSLECLAYPADKHLCIYTYLLEYLQRTKVCRGKETSLFISFQKPFHKVSKDTIARWLRFVMKQAGVDTDRFKPHSIRSAAVSKANTANVPVSEILSRAGWKNEQTFQKFYNKPIAKTSLGFVKGLLAE